MGAVVERTTFVENVIACDGDATGALVGRSVGSVLCSAMVLNASVGDALCLIPKKPLRGDPNREGAEFDSLSQWSSQGTGDGRAKGSFRLPLLIFFSFVFGGFNSMDFRDWD